MNIEFTTLLYGIILFIAGIFKIENTMEHAA